MVNRDYERVEAAIHYLGENFRAQPSLAELASRSGLSELHFQRLFTRWAGISPKRFLQFLTADYACRLLASSKSALDAAYDSGLSGPGRLHELTVGVHAASPGEVRSGGGGLTLRHGRHPTPFGDAFLAASDRGICALSFVSGARTDEELRRLRRAWPRATCREDQTGTRRLAQRIFARLTNAAHAGQEPVPLAVHLKGTNFQIRVWEALLRIPHGSVSTYGNLASAVGRPGAERAVGQAVGRNPVAFLIPCHRVIRESGALGGYRWGPARKMAMLGWEAARSRPFAENRSVL